MASTYTIEIDEGPTTDLPTLNSQHYNLAVAKGVAPGVGQSPVFNTIFLSSTDTPNGKPSPANQLTWTEQYGVNYTQTTPLEGAVLTGTGDWQAINIGDTYEINENGAFVGSTGGDPNSLNVYNNFQSAHVIVGIYDNNTQKYKPIFYGPDALLYHGMGSYIPKMTINLWWGEHTTTSSVISTQELPVETYTLTDPKTNPTTYFWYNTTAGEWKEQTSGAFAPA